MAKRQDIENLQTTLMGIMQHSTSKKIDVDDLKGKLAESLRKEKYSAPYNGKSAQIAIKKTKNADLMDNSETLKMYDQTETTPAWYKSLKKNVK